MSSLTSVELTRNNSSSKSSTSFTCSNSPGTGGVLGACEGGGGVCEGGGVKIKMHL